MFATSVLAFTAIFAAAECYKPVAIVHGLYSTPHTMDFLTNYIRARHPGTDVYSIRILTGDGDYLPMWYQVLRFNAELADFVKHRPHGIHLIGFSQGGLIARGILHTLPAHKVHTFISLGGPQMGYHGGFFTAKGPYYNLGNEEFYSSSISGFYRHPKYEEKYRQEGRFLAILNNDTYNPKSEEFKRNFLEIKKFVAVGGPDDDVMVPWQTTIWGFEDRNLKIVDYKHQEVYRKDSFGLRTLDERGGLIIHVRSGCNHANWHSNISVLECCVLPYLD